MSTFSLSQDKKTFTIYENENSYIVKLKDNYEYKIDSEYMYEPEIIWEHNEGNIHYYGLVVSPRGNLCDYGDITIIILEKGNEDINTVNMDYCSPYPPKFSFDDDDFVTVNIRGFKHTRLDGFVIGESGKIWKFKHVPQN